MSEDKAAYDVSATTTAEQIQAAETLKDVRAAIDQLQPQPKSEVTNHARNLRVIVQRGGPAARMAFALVGAEMAVDLEKHEPEEPH